MTKQPQRIHHIASHFTNGLLPAAAVCITLFLVTGDRALESATICCCTMAAIAAPVVHGSGLFDWRNRLMKRPARVFKHKRVVGLTLIAISMLLVALRFSVGVDLATAAPGKYIYTAVVYVLTGMVTYLGYLGGKFIV